MQQPETPRQKRLILGNLSDEVRDFHPLLERLLPRLPRVVAVEYTHGAGEKGADFVVSRQNDLLGDIEYVGVIAKVGKITQNLSQIEQQVDECDEERLILAGKKKIRLQEIWIVSNEGVTHGAKEKIFRKFASRKILFFDHMNVCDWIDQYLENYWYTIPPGVGDYLRILTSELRDIDRQHNLLPSQMSDFYVEQDLRKLEFTYGAKKNRSRQKTLASVFETIETNRITFIEGAPGSGKSQMLRHAGKHYADPVVYLTTKRLPVFTDFRSLCENWHGNLHRYLTERLATVGLEDVSLADVVLLVDGIDEHPRGYDEATGCLKEILAAVEACPRCKAVLTTRPMDKQEMERLIPKDIPRYDIVPLSLRKVGEFLQHICRKDRITERLFEDIKQSLLFQQLPMTPIAAILLAHLVEDEARDLPSNLTELYQRYCELMLGRWDICKGIESQKEFEAARSIVTDFARYSVENRLPEIAEAEARSMFASYLNERNLAISADVLFEKVTTRSGILQRNVYRGTVAFKHLSFAEFFYAMHKAAHVDKAFIDSRVYDPDWRNVYFFYLGIKKDCEETLQEMLNVAISSGDDRFFRIAHFGDYLMAAYTTPYRVVENALTQVVTECAAFYQDICSGNVDVALKTLPAIRLLELLKIIVASCYGYPFFQRAMDTAVVRIATDDKLPRDRQAYALFFLSTLYVVLKQPNPFKGLLDNVKEDLPFPVRFGIMYENEHVGHHSTLVTRQLRNLRQDVRRSAQLMHYAKQLHVVSVAEVLKAQAKRDQRKSNKPSDRTR